MNWKFLLAEMHPLRVKNDILPMQFMLTTRIKVEAMNRVAYVAGFVSIKMSLNIISLNWYSHNDKNVNIDMGFISTLVIIKWHLV